MINDFKFKAYYGLCYVSYFIEAEWNTLIWYRVSYLYYKSVMFSFSLSILHSSVYYTHEQYMTFVIFDNLIHGSADPHISPKLVHHI